MKAKRSTLKRRVITVVSALVSMFLMGGAIPAFAHRLDDDSYRSSNPATQSVSTTATGGGRAWIVALIVIVGVLALSAALIGTVRRYRGRARAAIAGI